MTAFNINNNTKKRKIQGHGGKERVSPSIGKSSLSSPELTPTDPAPPFPAPPFLAPPFLAPLFLVPPFPAPPLPAQLPSFLNLPSLSSLLQPHVYPVLNTFSPLLQKLVPPFLASSRVPPLLVSFWSPPLLASKETAQSLLCAGRNQRATQTQRPVKTGRFRYVSNNPESLEATSQGTYNAPLAFAFCGVLYSFSGKHQSMAGTRLLIAAAGQGCYHSLA